MKLRKVLALTLAAAMTFSLVGCGSDGNATADAPAAEDTASDDGAAEEAPAADEADDEAQADAPAGGVPGYLDIKLGEDYTDLTTTIQFLHCRTDREEDGTIAALLAEFNEMYPNITVETEGVTDYAEDALLRLSTGEWGDIMWIPAVDTKDLSSYFMPLGSLDAMSQELNFVSAWSYDGTCYGIPVWGNAQGVVYNKAVFEEAGITALPTTPDEFIADLQLIKDNTDAIPLYTNYAAGWTMGAWDAYVGVVSNGDDTYMNQKFAHTAAPFDDPGDGTGIYNLYKILFDAVEKDLIEADYTTTDWEGCKGMINNGEIGAMVLGSWAFSQMVEAGEHGDDIGYMPFPMTVNGTQYVLAGGDYNYAVNINSSDDNKIASLIFIKWMIEKSDWNYSEGCYTTYKNGKNPEMYSAFDSCTMLSDVPAIAGEEDLLGEMNAESELSFNAGGNAKVQRIVEAAATGSETFDDIMADWTAAWNSAQDELGVDAQ
ncbi:MAG: ABC transporter substrate-binding protein [Lachnospiraceae bacterium]|nr:ABC transporter substrate-binding protein [Lachnospiraceae bacterium]